MKTAKIVKTTLFGLGLSLLPVALAPVSAVAADEASAVVQAAQVNINTADAATLASQLNGVGISRARAIIEFREQFGPFESVEDLMQVKGIGAATLEHNRSRIGL